MRFRNGGDWFSRAATINHCRLRGCNIRRFIFSQFWRLKCKVKVLAGLVSSAAPFLGLEMATLFPGFHTDFPRRARIPGVFLCVQLAFSCEDTSHIRLGPTLTTRLLNHPFTGPRCKYGPILRYWELRLQHTNRGCRAQFVP